MNFLHLFWLFILLFWFFILVLLPLECSRLRSIKAPVEQSVLTTGLRDVLWFTKSVDLLVTIVSFVEIFDVIGEITTTHAKLTILSHIFLLLSPSFGL